MLFGSRLKKRFISLLGLVILGLAIHFLDVQRPQSFDLFSDVPSAPTEPDYYTVNSTFNEFNEQGLLVHSLKTERLLHYPSTEETALEKPVITSYNDAGAPLWKASGDSGLLEGDGSHFQLNQNVIVWQIGQQVSKQSANPNPIQMQLTTEQLNIDMDNNQASSDQAIRIVTPEGTTDAVGLFVDMSSNRIVLESQVEGRYQTKISPIETLNLDPE